MAEMGGSERDRITRLKSEIDTIPLERLEREKERAEAVADKLRARRDRARRALDDAQRAVDEAHEWHVLLVLVTGIRARRSSPHEVPPALSRNGRRLGAKRAAILELVQAGLPGEQWAPAAVFERISGGDPALRPEDVQMTMARMAKDGQLERVGYGLYALPRAGGP